MHSKEYNNMTGIQGRSQRGQGAGGRVPPGWEEVWKNQPQKQGKSGKMGRKSGKLGRKWEACGELAPACGREGLATALTT